MLCVRNVDFKSDRERIDKVPFEELQGGTHHQQRGLQALGAKGDVIVSTFTDTSFSWLVSAIAVDACGAVEGTEVLSACRGPRSERRRQNESKGLHPKVHDALRCRVQET